MRKSAFSPLFPSMYVELLIFIVHFSFIVHFHDGAFHTRVRVVLILITSWVVMSVRQPLMNGKPKGSLRIAPMRCLESNVLLSQPKGVELLSTCCFRKQHCFSQLLKRTSIQGCESSSFQLISSFLEIFLCQNFTFFFYFQPIFGIFIQFQVVFPRFLSVTSHTHLSITCRGWRASSKKFVQGCSK